MTQPAYRRMRIPTQAGRTHSHFLHHLTILPLYNTRITWEHNTVKTKFRIPAKQKKTQSNHLQIRCCFAAFETTSLLDIIF